MKRLGFIGMGNMAQALASGFIASEIITPENLYAYAPHQKKLRENASRIGFQPVSSVSDLASICDTLIMACKPYQIESVLTELGDALNGLALVSIAAGWDFARYRKYVGDEVRVQCVMPNTPAMVGEGVLLFEETSSLEEEERDELIRLFASVGVVEELPSSLMGIGGAVTGCGPAFIDQIIEAYADAAVMYGVPRDTAYRLVSQMILGSARLQLESGEHPAVLKDRVTSPAGTTIAGCAELEHAGLRSACIRSIDAVMKRKI